MPFTSSTPPIYYEDRGSGEPVLAITGFGLSSAVFDPLVLAGESRMRWITFDHPGTGRSRAARPAVTTARLAAGATAVLDELKLDCAHIFGVSLGGAVALELALQRPERVRSLILVATSADGPLQRGVDLPRLAAVGRRVAVGSVKRRRLWLAPMLFSEEYIARGPRPRIARPGREAEPSPSQFALLGQAWAASLHDRARELHRIGAPSLVLHARDDALVPVDNARRLAFGLPRAQLRVTQRGGHGFALEYPHETVTTVADWLSGLTDPEMPPP
jgi:pimeloyl-ACP methyl ester carboxylesterase